MMPSKVSYARMGRTELIYHLDRLRLLLEEAQVSAWAASGSGRGYQEACIGLFDPGFDVETGARVCYRTRF